MAYSLAIDTRPEPAMGDRPTLRVFISAPGDVAEERELAAQVVGTLARDYARFFTLEAVLWEHQPKLASGHFQDCIVPPSSTDIVVTILWSRLGTALPARTRVRAYRGIDGRAPVTGTEWEFEEAKAANLAAGRPELLVYRKSGPGHFTAATHEQVKEAGRQMEALDAFWRRHFTTEDGNPSTAWTSFNRPADFALQVERDLRTLLDRRVAALDGLGGNAVDWPGCPFLGLRSFEFAHEPVFFGRSAAIREVTEALKARAAAGSAFLLVAGDSGSGKSSLLKAGVIPNLLKPGVVGGVAFWRRAVFRPGTITQGDLFDALVEALVEKPAALPELVDGLSRADIAAQFRRGEGAETVKQALHHAAVRDGSPDAPPRAGRLVLLLDQLEELFLPRTGADQREDFARLLARLAAGGAVWLLATMRWDFVPRLTEVPALLALAAGAGLHPLRGPQAEEIGQMIRRPAQAAGLLFEEDENGIGLDAVLLRDATGNPGALPLLEFALERLYQDDVETAGGHVLTYGTYRRLGAKAGGNGLAGAVAEQADKAVASLPATARETVLPSVLLSMVDLDEERPEVVVARQARHGGETADAWDAVVAALVQARLVVLRSDGDGTKQIALAHEALLQHWPLLGEIVAEHDDFLRARRRVEIREQEWRADGKPDSGLLTEANRLSDGLLVLGYPQAGTGAELIDFIEASKAAVEAQRSRELRRQKRLTGLFAGFGLAAALLALLAGLGGWFAWSQRAALLERESLRLAELSRQAALAGEETKSILLALLSASSMPTGQAEMALAGALGSVREIAILRGHGGPVTSAVFTPDGGRIVTTSTDRTARLWNATGGHELATFEGHQDAVLSATFSPDGSRMATVSVDNTVRLWPAGTDAVPTVLQGYKRNATLSPDGRFIVTVSDTMVRLREAATGRELVSFNASDNYKTNNIVWRSNDSGPAMVSQDGSRMLVNPGAYMSYSLWNAADGSKIAQLWNSGPPGSDEEFLHRFSPDGRKIATIFKDLYVPSHPAYKGCGVEIWEASTGRKLATLPFNNPPRIIRFNPNGSRIIAASGDGTAELWDTTGRKLTVLAGHSKPISTLAFSPDGSRIITASEDGTAKLWNAFTGGELAELKGHREGITTGSFSPDGNRIVTTSKDRTARLWETSTARELAVLRGHQGVVVHATFDPDGRRIITTSADGTARLWDDAGMELAVLRGHRGSVKSAVFQADGRQIITTSADETVRLWDSASGQPLLDFRERGEVFTSGAFSADGLQFVVGTGAGSVEIWDLTNGKRLEFAGAWGGVTSARFSPDGRRIAVASADGTIRLLEAVSGNDSIVFRGHDGKVTSVDFSPDGRHIVSASVDGTVRLWATSDKDGLAVFRGHTGAVRSAAFSPDGQRIVTASADGTARLWDVSTGRTLFVFRGHEQGGASAAFSPDGQRIVTASDDGTARVWQLARLTPEFLKDVKAKLPRCLTVEEEIGYFLRTPDDTVDDRPPDHCKH